MPPTLDEKSSWYGGVFNRWFETTIYFRSNPKLAEMKTTFLEGGYYRYDITDNLSLLALNTLYFGVKNTIDLAQGDA